MINQILESLKGSTAEIIFLSICLSGAVISGFSLLFGGHGDDVDHGEAGGDHDGDHGPGLLSIRGLSLFATGFGGFAFLVHYYIGKVLISSVAGILSGSVFALVGVAFVSLFFKQQASSLITPSQMSGAIGIVNTPIPGEGFGEVFLTVADQQIARRATTEGSNAIPSGTQVRVVRHVGGTVVVEEVSSDKEE